MHPLSQLGTDIHSPLLSLKVKRGYYTGNVLPLQWTELTETVHTARLAFWVHNIHKHKDVCVCFVLPWTVESFPFMLWRWCNKLKWAPFELFALSPLLRVRS